MRMNRTREESPRPAGAVGRFVAVLAVVLLLAGCSGGGDDAEAAPGETITLRVGTDDRPGRPAADQIEHFADEVAKLSDGRITIEPVWQAVGNQARRPDWDQQVARLVGDGELEMGLVPSRAWDTEGVTTLRPLSAPFLITDDSLLADVLTGDLAGTMMSGLPAAGVEGLAIFPEGLRHPFGYDGPLVAPDDYDGSVIRVPTSSTATAMFAALGAETNDAPPDAGVHAGIESSFHLVPGGVAASNVTFYPKANVLVINADALGGLAEGDREILEQSAANTLTWSVDTIPSDAEAAEAFCEAGGAIAHAGDKDLEALVAATRPVMDDLKSDTANADVIADIEKLKDSAELAPPAPECDKADVPDGPAEPDDGQASAIQGTFRFELTEANGLAVAPAEDRDNVLGNVGTWTFTFDGRGDFTVHQVGPLEPGYNDAGTYEVVGDRLTFTWPSQPGTPVEVYEFEFEGDDLVLRVIDDGDYWWANAATMVPWKRVPE